MSRNRWSVGIALAVALATAGIASAAGKSEDRFAGNRQGSEIGTVTSAARGTTASGPLGHHQRHHHRYHSHRRFR